MGVDGAGGQAAGMTSPVGPELMATAMDDTLKLVEFWSGIRRAFIEQGWTAENAEHLTVMMLVQSLPSPG